MVPIITLTGDLGSGKTIIAKKLCEKTGFPYFSTGQLQRQLAEKYNMSTLELNLLSETNKSIDNEIDSHLKRMNDQNQSFIVDARLGWFFIPRAFKIYLITRVEVAAERIITDVNRKSEQYESAKEAVLELRARKESESQRFLKVYGADLANFNNYDLIVDTSFAKPDNIIKVIFQSYERKLKQLPFHKFWLSPSILYPTKQMDDISEKTAEVFISALESYGFDHIWPIHVRKIGTTHFIGDGHRRSHAALRSDKDLIPIRFL